MKVQPMQLADNRYFQVARKHIDAMLSFGRDPVNDPPHPLFGGVVDPQAKRTMISLTPPPPGVRTTDFNWCGNNLMHDIPLVECMIALTRLTGEAGYDAAVDEMLKFYGANCAHPETGLFGWGEHGQWSYADSEILPCTFTGGLKAYREHGWMVHDHLRCAPPWFWDRLWKHHPQAVVRFAHGLNGHIVDEKTFEHNRHASLTGKWWRDPKNPDMDKGKDFARHAGFFILDCLFAASRSDDRSLVDWSRRKLQWHMGRRLANGIVSGCARTAEENAEGQHDSFSLSVLEAAELFPEGSAERAEFAAAALELLDARVRQKRGGEVQLPAVPCDGRIWRTGYFRKTDKAFALPPGNIFHMIHQRTGSQWHADSLVAAARWLVRELLPPPVNVPVTAGVFHQFIELLIAAHKIAGDPAFMTMAAQVADWAIQTLDADPLLAGVSYMRLWRTNENCEQHFDPWAEEDAKSHKRASLMYYSGTGTPLLVRSLMHLAILQTGTDDILGIDLHRR